MSIVSYCVHISHTVCVAYAALDNVKGHIDYAAIPEDSKWVNCEPFELAEEKWFGIHHTLIVRFPKDRERDWRVKKATELVEAGSADPVVLYQNAQNAAYLLGIDLNEFLKELKKLSQDPNETLTTLYNKWKSTLNMPPL